MNNNVKNGVRLFKKVIVQSKDNKEYIISKMRCWNYKMIIYKIVIWSLTIIKKILNNYNKLKIKN